MGSNVSRRRDETEDGSHTSQPAMAAKQHRDSLADHIHLSKEDLARYRPLPSRSDLPPPLSKAQSIPAPEPSPADGGPPPRADTMEWTREDGKPGSSMNNAIEISDDDYEPRSKARAAIQVVDDSDEENIFDDTRKPKIKQEAASEGKIETMSWTRTSGAGSAGNAICVSDSTDSEPDVDWPATPSKRPTSTCTPVKQEAPQFNPPLLTSLIYNSDGSVATRPAPKIRIPSTPAVTRNPEPKNVTAGGRALSREQQEHIKGELRALATPPQTPERKHDNRAEPPISRSKGKQRAKADDETLYPSLAGLSTPPKTFGRSAPPAPGRRGEQARELKKEESTDHEDFSIPGAWSTHRREDIKLEETLSKLKLEEEGVDHVKQERNPLPTPESTPVRSKGRASAKGSRTKPEVKAKPDVEEYLPSPAPTPVSKKGENTSALVPARRDRKGASNRESPSIRSPKPRTEHTYFSLSNDCLPRIDFSSPSCQSVEIDGVDRFHFILPNSECLSWYQSLDAWRMLTGMAERHVKRLCGGKLEEEVEAGPQGFALCYAMGMGKTHVVVAVLYMLRMYMKEVGKVVGASAPPLKKNLIVAPVGLHGHWNDHLTRLTGGTIKVEIYNRTGKHSSGLSKSTAHIIITSPETLVSDRKRFKESRAAIETLITDALAHGDQRTSHDLREMFTRESDERHVPREAPLGTMEWGVVVVDEFHDRCLANAENLASRAVLSLDADEFALLSGTPAQNSVNGDLQAPLQLLSTHKSRRKDVSVVEQEYAKMGKKIGSKDVVKYVDVYSKESQGVLRATFITRQIVNPVTGKQVIELPRKTVYYVHVKLNDVERRAYDTIPDMVTCVLVRFMRERLACDNTLVALKLMADTIRRNQDVEGEQGEADDGNDGVPQSAVSDRPRPRHLPTNEDIWEAVALAKPEPDEFKEKVQDKILSDLARKAGVDERVLGDRFVSSKFAAVSILVNQLPQGEKMIIFSMFTSVLDEVGSFLENNRHDAVKYDGRMNTKARDTALRTISDDPSKRIILVSLKAGGVGLNITACNHVILLDPWWNPYVEDQAIARAWRIGQKKEVHVYHVVCPETVEDRILEVQKRKKGEIEAFMEGLARVTHEGDRSRA